jgi:hypothetical protein
VSVTIAFTDQDKLTLRTAAYGAISLLAAASGKPHRVATDASIALCSATGQVGRVLSARKGGMELGGKTTADLADRVLPTLAEAMTLLDRQDPAEAANFREIIAVIVETAVQRGGSTPALASMVRKINAAVDAA